MCFQPETLFPHDDTAGLEFFADWSLQVCERVKGTKLITIDEAQRHLSPSITPPCLKTVFNRGRRRGLDSIFISHSAMECGPKLRREITEVVTYHFTEQGDRDWLQDHGFDPETVRALPLHGRLVRDRFGRQVYQPPEGAARSVGHAPQARHAVKARVAADHRLPVVAREAGDPVVVLP